MMGAAPWKLACKQALRMGYSEICFRIARAARARVLSSLSRPPPSYSKANLGITRTECLLQATLQALHRGRIQSNLELPINCANKKSSSSNSNSIVDASNASLV